MRIYFETYGCTMNQSDTQIMKGMLKVAHELVENPEDCELAVVNSCGVIAFTERKILRRIKELKETGKKVVVAGCLPDINIEALKALGVDGVLSARNVGLIKDFIEGKTIPESTLEKSSLPKLRDAGVIAVVPIAEGCLGKCSYCATRLARGRLKSFSMNSIMKQIEVCARNGYKEIQLTAQDTAAYGIDSGIRLPELLRKICSLPYDFRVRVGMMNPEFALGILDDLIGAFEDEKIYKFLHLPVQSGDNEILENMLRNYTADDFVEIVNSFRGNFDNLTLSTDVIVGYPAENEESFLKTYKLIEKIKPDVLNVKMFSPRPKTLAARLRDMPHRLKKQRSRKLTELHKKIGLEINRKFVGRELEVLITENGKNSTMQGRTNSYKSVVLKAAKLGEFVNVKIKDATASYLIAFTSQHPASP